MPTASPARPVLRFAFPLVLLLVSVTTPLFAATLSDPAVDSYNMRVGTQTFDPEYYFTTNTRLVETANAITNMGSDTIKMEIAQGFFGKYFISSNPSITNLVTLVRNEPSCRHVFDMPFRHYVLWTYAFSTSTPDWNNGYTSSSDRANDYREFHDLTQYLLTNYNNSGKTFYLGHWEGDGYLEVNNWSTNPPLTWTTGFVNYLNNRQKAIDDAKAETGFTNVNVFGYAECNRVRDAMLNGANNNVRMINYVIPYVTNLDYVSYSSYDMQRLSTADMTTTLDYVEAHLPTNKVSVIPGERVWIGEYGYANAGDSPATQEPETRAYIQRLLNYGRQGIPYILFWEIYDNEKNSDGSYKYFYLIDPSNNPAPCYFLHQRFLNGARLLTAQFKESNGRLPTDSEWVALVSLMLNAPLPAPVPLAVTNSGWSMQPNSVTVSGTVAQGVYGDDAAVVWVFYGPEDGGTSRNAWAMGRRLGTNTWFNPATFSTTLVGLAPNTTYHYRFYVTNANGEAWAPAATPFTLLAPQALDPSQYGCRARVTFAGYNRGETLTNFPALVNLSTALPGFSYAQFASPTGGDLRFTDASGTNQLLFELDEWNPGGTSTAWVRVPQLSGTNDFIWAYWGNPAAASLPATSTNGVVWSTDHVLVWHLKESGFPYADSTLAYPALTGKAPASTTGIVGRGCAFDGSTEYLDAGPVAVGSAFTLSAWVKVDPSANNIQTVLANKPTSWNSAGFGLYVNSYNTTDGELRLETGDGTGGATAATGTGAVDTGSWHQVAAVVDEVAGSARLYVDGTDRTASSTIATDFPNQTGLNLGRLTNNAYYFKGVLDEVRIESGKRSSNWVWASYLTTAANTALVSYSAVNPQPSLVVGSSGSGPVLSWPYNAGPFKLLTTTNLAPTSTWVPATNAAVLVNGQWQVQLGTGDPGSHFYRLRQ